MEINTFVDFDDIYSRKRPATDTGLLPYYPTSSREGLYNILYGEVVHRKRGTNLGETRVMGASGLCGAGAEAASLYPNDPDMIKACIRAQYDIVGVACTEYNHSHDGQDQGFVTAIGGLHTVDKYGNRVCEPGQIARVELPDDDPSVANSSKLSASGRPLAKYQWTVVPEDYNTPGDLLLTHLTHITEDEQRWRQAMGPQRNIDIDKWLATHKATGDSAIMEGLLLIYTLMKKGYLISQNPQTGHVTSLGAATPVNDPYLQPDIDQPARHGGIQNDMKPHDFVVRMAELLGTQPFSGSSQVLSPTDQVYFNSLRRIVMSTVFYTGKYRTYEFGQKQGRNAPAIPTRDVRSGLVEKGTKEGLFFANQLNHVRRRMGCELQALDDHTRFRIGRFVSGPNRIKRNNISIERTFL